MSEEHFRVSSKGRATGTNQIQSAGETQSEQNSQDGRLRRMGAAEA